MGEKFEQSSLPEANRYQTRTPKYQLDQHVILTDTTRGQLEECIALLKFHATIYKEWNFGSVDSQGSSAVLNFFGPPGTGKTLAAEALAGTLGQQFLPVNIVDLESSLKGQMSKNIQDVFRLAYEEQALLFFDEADAILGRRIAVSQGIDSDINATRNTMMTEISAHQGLVVFATNYPRDYDAAIKSRITHVVNFELPDEDARRRLWNRFLVAQIPLGLERDELLLHLVAVSDEMSGRDILNSVRRALPKALLDSERTGGPPMLQLHHVEEAVDLVRFGQRARNFVAKPPDGGEDDDGTIRRVLGIQ